MPSGKDVASFGNGSGTAADAETTTAAGLSGCGGPKKTIIWDFTQVGRHRWGPCQWRRAAVAEKERLDEFYCPERRRCGSTCASHDRADVSSAATAAPSMWKSPPGPTSSSSTNRYRGAPPPSARSRLDTHSEGFGYFVYLHSCSGCFRLRGGLPGGLAAIGKRRLSTAYTQNGLWTRRHVWLELRPKVTNRTPNAKIVTMSRSP